MTFPSVPPPGPGGSPPRQATLSRRAVLRGGALSGAALFSLAGFRHDSGATGTRQAPGTGTRRAPGAGGARDAAESGAGQGAPPAEAALTAATGPGSPARSYDFNQGWLFGGVYANGSEQPGYHDGGFSPVTLPHTVASLSWGGWDHTSWENVWIYCKHFAGADIRDGRVFADFDGAATNATVVMNGVTVATHQGGYLPFSAELTGQLTSGDNVLAVIVDARWQDVPPGNPAGGTTSVDYRPSVIVWATRLNETASVAGLYDQTRQLAYDLDGTRQTTGAMSSYSLTGWAEDVYGYDDYHSGNGIATLKLPLPGVPWLVSEAVGALDGPPLYRWTDSAAVLATQGQMHAQVHNIAQADTRYAGLLGWCAFDYASLNGGDRIWNNLKTPGVLDTFRVPKPGAAFYRAQVSPADHPVILPMFFWDFGPGSPAFGPGPGAIIATNCDRLDIYLNGTHIASTTPDVGTYGNLAFPLAFADVTTIDGASRPELRIDGSVAGRVAASVRMSADTSRDRLSLVADDTSIQADGSDTARLTFRALDAYGNQRPYVSGDVTLTLAGPATLVGDNPFHFGEYGGVGGVFVRSAPGRTGLVTVTAEHPTLGYATARLTVTPALGRTFL